MSTILWSIPLSSHYLPTGNNQPTELMQDDASWQSGIVEGPDMVETSTTTGGTTTSSYTLFYSGSDEGASTYAIGWASCPSGPAAGCTDRATSGPLLTSSAGMSGPGGPDVYSLPAAGGASPQLVMAFAAWQGSTIGYLDCGIRPMYLADLNFVPFGGLATPTVSPADPGATPAANPSCPTPATPAPGYWQVASDGGIFSFGAAQFYGSTGSMHLNKPVVAMAATPNGNGYWLVASDGGVFAYGNAQFYGSTGSITLNKPIIGMIPTLDGGGYWLIASDGGVFAFGDAKFYGSAASDNLAYPVTAAAPSFLNGGYWLVDANGQVFNFGDAVNEGQPPFAPGGYRITGMAGTQNSNGYWLASANGNVADFGDAAPYGSMVGTNLNAPVVGMAANSQRDRLLAPGRRRRHLHLRPGRVLWLNGGPSPQRAHGWHRGHLTRPGPLRAPAPSPRTQHEHAQHDRAQQLDAQRLVGPRRHDLQREPEDAHAGGEDEPDDGAHHQRHARQRHHYDPRHDEHDRRHQRRHRLHEEEPPQRRHVAVGDVPQVDVDQPGADHEDGCHHHRPECRPVSPAACHRCAQPATHAPLPSTLAAGPARPSPPPLHSLQ